MKKIAIGGVILVMLVGGVGYGVMTMRQAVAPETTGVVPAVPVSTTTAESAPSDHVTGSDSLQGLVALGKTLECSFRSGDDTATTEGSAFFSNGKVRVDTMNSGASSSAETSSMIMSDGTMYSWSKTKEGSFAIKMPLSALGTTSTQKRPEKAVSLDNKVQYDCKPWQVDGSVFVPPADITFMDMGEMMKGIPAGMKIPQR